MFRGAKYNPDIDKTLDIFHQNLYFTILAEVVELADALRSGRSVLKDVGVQLPPSAPGAPKFSERFFIDRWIAVFVHPLDRPHGLRRFWILSNRLW